MFRFKEYSLQLSGERFAVVYTICGEEREAYEKALDICLEQTVEFPGELVPSGTIKDEIVGRIELFEPVSPDRYKAVISFATETAADEMTQLLNVIFGNISIKRGIRVEQLLLSNTILNKFKGPRFGRAGLRELLSVKKRPLLFTALKPMGLSSADLAKLAYQFALGGIDIIKDDHGLSNQQFSPYAERVKLCAAAVAKANRETGNNSIYMPNITASYREIEKRAQLAKEAGAGGLLISPGLTGLDAMRVIAEDDNLNLPVIAHPAFQGSYTVTPDSGVAHFVMYGQLPRLAGADGSIYPNYGGRFPFTKEECKSIAEGTAVPMGHILPIFPCPAGGMSLQSIPESLELYGRDVVFLIGGGLFKHGPDLVKNCRYFLELVDTL